MIIFQNNYHGHRYTLLGAYDKNNGKYHMLVIETENLRKEFQRPRITVKGLTLEVNAGEVFGFLGPNGAGKTTFIKMMLGLVKPTSGQARMLGLPWPSTTARAKTGFLPEHLASTIG